MDDPIKMYRRLYSLAFKRFGCNPDAAHDVASDAVCAMIQARTDDFNFGFTVALNRCRMDARNRKRRKTYQFPVDDEGEPVELKLAATIASQDLALQAIECVNAIENLPSDTGAVMRLVAMEYTSDEIADMLSLPKAEVYWRTQYGRRLLRERAGYELERKRGHHKYIGIRKDHHKWCATIRKGDGYFHLGYFATAAEAARAYDAKARELHGGAAKTNFSQAAE